VNDTRAATVPARFAATDMLHRRTPLVHALRLTLGESTVRIRTDSLLIGEALRRVVRDLRGVRMIDESKWEIAVELQDGPASLLVKAKDVGIETCRFGAARSVRLDSGSWFAHTPPSMSGVGFAMIAGNEKHQVQQLAAYLRTILRFLADDVKPHGSCIEREVQA